MAELQKVIDTLDKAAEGFDKIANSEQRKIYGEVLVLAKDLETDATGKVKQSIANLKRLTLIKAKLAELSKNKEWVAGLSAFSDYFGILQKEQNAYYSQHFPSAMQSETAKKKNEMLRQLAVQNTMDALMGDGLKANVTDKLNDILLRAVTSGARFGDLQEELRAYLLGKDGGQGAFARYATTYATTALSQFTGQVNKLATDDLDTDWFVYEGSNIETTREFCEHLTAKRFIHKSEIPTILKGRIDDYQCAIYEKTGLPYGMIEGTTPENFQCNCGGWNCRHQLIPVADAMVPKALRERMEKTIKAQKQLSEYKAKDDTLDLPTLGKGKLLAADPITAIAIGSYEQLSNAIKSIYKIKVNSEKARILRAIAKSSDFVPIKNVSTKNGNVYGYTTEQYDYKDEKEMPKNVHLASKIANDGYDVYLVPNIDTTSADYIVNKKGKYDYIEGKITNGKRGISNSIDNGQNQSPKIAIDVQIGMRANDVAESLRSAFQKHKYLQEVWLYKGGRRIMVRRQWAESKEFMKEFRKAWSAKK